MAEKYTATVLGERGKEFEAVFGSATVPIKRIEPTQVETELDRCAAFEIDLTGLTDAQHFRLVEHIARKYCMTMADAQAWVNSAGVGVPAAECVVSIHNTAWNL